MYVNGGGRKTFQELYEDYLSTLPSITVSSSDVSTSTSSIYSYNGVELPALPDWDQEAYPYACIVRSWSGSYCFIATKSPAYVRNSTTASRSNDLVLDWDSNSMRCFLAFDGLSWGIPSLSTAYGDVLFYRESSGNDIFMWANYDVYYGSSLYLAASEPVFVSGSVSTSTTNDRFGLYMEELDEWNKTYGYDANEYAANYFITPDNGDSLYSSAVFSESTMTFTEPVTGEQFLCSSWTYDYTGDNTLVLCGYPIEGTYCGSYILDLAEPVTINGRSISNYWIVYMDDSLWIIPYYFSDSGLFCVPSGSAQSYSFVMVSQTECGIGNHTYTYETVTEPTCGTPGERKYTCSVCGDEYAEDIPATGKHTYKSSVTQEATCAASGVMTYTCSICGTEYTETIASTGVHSYEYSISVDPTCIADGIGLYTCSVCGNQYTEPIAMLEHDWLASEVTATTYDLPEGTSCPSCAGTAFTHTRSGDIYTCTCSDCGTEWSVNAVITYGSTTYTCSRCGETYVESEDPDSGLFAALANFLSDGITWVTGKFTELAESINSIHTTFRSYLQKIQNVGGDFPAFLSAAVGIMPEDFMAVVWFSIVALVILAVWLKFFK